MAFTDADDHVSCDAVDCLPSSFFFWFVFHLCLFLISLRKFFVHSSFFLPKYSSWHSSGDELHRDEERISNPSCKTATTHYSSKDFIPSEFDSVPVHFFYPFPGAEGDKQTFCCRQGSWTVAPTLALYCLGENPNFYCFAFCLIVFWRFSAKKPKRAGTGIVFFLLRSKRSWRFQKQNKGSWGWCLWFMMIKS